RILPCWGVAGSVRCVKETAKMLATQYLKALGGMDNLQAMSVCLTRLSLRVCDIALVDQSRLPGLGCLCLLYTSPS
ncbi:PTS transporter subunit EIIB, partial [Aeromonas salmonicida]|uniref:PTS transporter subunit EIIB n=1 Tax=Aeromonas salmonicida TaxID=645 RepID=UPI003D312092